MYFHGVECSVYIMKTEKFRRQESISLEPVKQLSFDDMNLVKAELKVI